MNLKQWLAGVAPGVSINAAASAVGMSQTTLNSQANGSAAVRAETVVALARAYGADPVVALVDHGLLRADEVTGVSADELRAQIKREMEDARLEDMSDERLTAEVRRLLAVIDERLARPEGRA